MSNDYLMVPVKYSVLSVANKDERIVYIPVATTETAGIVKIGEGLKVDYYGLVSLADDVQTLLNKVKDGDILAKGFYEHKVDVDYPKDAIVFSQENKDFYVSLKDNNVAELDDAASWNKLGLREQLEAKEIILSDGRDIDTVISEMETAMQTMSDDISKKVNIAAGEFLIENKENGIRIGKYKPNVFLDTRQATVNITDENAVVIGAHEPTAYGRAETTKLEISAGSRPKLTVKSDAVMVGGGNSSFENESIAVLSDVIQKQDKEDQTLNTSEKTIVGAINELNSNKQNKKPNGNINLINEETGKIDNAYVPTNISGTSRIFAGTFGEDGIIVASAYASDVDGLDINSAVYKKTGYEFLYTGTNPFMLQVPVDESIINNFGDIVIEEQEVEINNRDMILANGERVYPGWSIIDNSDKVVSVNGMTGAVELNFATIDDVNNAINGMWEESY